MYCVYNAPLLNSIDFHILTNNKKNVVDFNQVFKSWEKYLIMCCKVKLNFGEINEEKLHDCRKFHLKIIRDHSHCIQVKIHRNEYVIMMNVKNCQFNG